MFDYSYMLSLDIKQRDEMSSEKYLSVISIKSGFQWFLGLFLYILICTSVKHDEFVFCSLKRVNCNPHKASPDPTPVGVRVYTSPLPPVQGLPTKLTLAHKHTQADWQRAGIGTTMPHSCVSWLRMRRWERFKKGRSGMKGGDLVGMNREIV